MFLKLQDLLDEAAQTDWVKIVVLTGSGDYFTIGYAFMNYFSKKPGEEVHDIEALAINGRNVFHKLIKTIIDFPKILVAVVNGHAVGTGVTMLGLFDLVYSIDTALFRTTFGTIGQSPEGCSFILPRLIGYGKATELLIFGRSMTAHEGAICGLVTNVFSAQEEHKVWDKLHKYANMSSISLLNLKKMLRKYDLETLHKVRNLFLIL